MPWTPKDAERFTNKAKSDRKKRQWQHVANNVLARGGSEEEAIKQANEVVDRTK